MSWNKGKSKVADWLLAHATCAADECLTWPFSTTRGYGMLKFEGKQQYAHRVMCRLVNGEPPSPRHQAAHTCGRGDQGCVNPKHLTWKLPIENQGDRKLHGTVNRDWRTSSKLTPAQREEVIAAALTTNQTFDEIAARYGITRRGVAWIVKASQRERKIPEPLTVEQVMTIRRIGYSKTAQEIADMLGIGRTPVDRVRTGKGFKHVGTH